VVVAEEHTRGVAGDRALRRGTGRDRRGAYFAAAGDGVQRAGDAGLRIALFFTRLYNRLLRPGIAAVVPELHTMSTALKGAFDALTARIDAINE
jgi:hypothetical protein